MARQLINIGSTPNDNLGDSLRAGFQKVNDMTQEIYNFQSSGLSYRNVKTISGSVYNIDYINDNVLLVDTNTGQVKVILPPVQSGTQNRQFTIKKISTGTASCIVAPSGSQNLDGGSGIYLIGQNDSITVVTFNTGSFII